MRLEDIMTTPAITVAPDTTAAQARETITKKRIHHMVVIENGKVVGVISARDLARPSMETVREAMSEDPVMASPHTTVREAANLLRGSGIGCLPVLDPAQKVVGIVTISDLLELIGKGAEKGLAHQTRRGLWGGRGRRPKSTVRSGQ